MTGLLDAGRAGALSPLMRALRAGAASPATTAAVVLALTLVRIVFATILPLADDESYYRLLAHNPAWSYYDHPPMTVWWIVGGVALFGDTAFGIRVFGILSIVVTSLAVFRTAMIVFADPAIASRAVLWLNGGLLIGAAFVVMTPDQPSTMFWALALWAAAAWVRDPRPWRWLVLGGTVGLGLLSKYTVLFILPGLLLWLLTDRERRRELLRIWPWLGLGLATVVFAPVIAWNAAHDWASFAMQFGRGVPDGFAPQHLAAFLSGEAALFGLLATPFLLRGAVRAWRGVRGGEAGRSLLLLVSLPLFAFFVLHALHSPVNPNWTAPIYSAYALLAADGAAGLGLRGRLDRGLRALRGWVAPVGVVSVLLLFAFAAAPFAAAVTARAPTQQLRGWDGFADDVVAVARAAGAEWIATTGHSLTGQLSLHQDELPVIQINDRVRYAAGPDPDPELLHRPALYINIAARGVPEFVARRFATVEELGIVVRADHGVEIRGYAVALVARPVAASPLLALD